MLFPRVQVLHTWYTVLLSEWNADTLAMILSGFGDCYSERRRSYEFRELYT